MSEAEVYTASDGRMVAMVVRADFDDFTAFPPTFDTEEERAWLREHYRVDSPELERATKAHLTDDALPLQLTMLMRPAGAFVKAHYHVNEEPPRSNTRHQVMVCLSGRARVGLFATEGEHVADVELGAGDAALLCEGHSIETLAEGTRLLEVKQGPMPANPFDDNVPVPGTS